MTKPLISIIVTTYNTEKFVKICLDSIIDQDYPNKQIIVVDDGSTDKSVEVATKILSKLPKGTSLIIEKPHTNAPDTRNTGFKEAKGDYILFLDTDKKLAPGWFTNNIDFLEKNPEYGFQYGGYSICDDDALENVIMEYRADTFDTFFLKQFNYIDGSNIMRVECFDYVVRKQGGWDPELKSLQDWDIWLTITEKYKGYYEPTINFYTALPGGSGISCPPEEWLNRMDAVKKKHGLKDNKLCVTSLGAPEHAKKMAKVLDADFRIMPSQKPHRYEMIYCLGFYPQAIDSHASIFKDHKGVRLIHWIGTDILQLAQLQNISALKVKEILNSEFKNQLSEVEYAQDRLKFMGVKTDIVPLPVENEVDVCPLPEDFSVAVYVPDNNREVHNLELLKEIMQIMPDVKFKVFGTASEVGEQDNIEYLGYLDKDKMKKLIQDTSMLLRLTVHDGLPLSVCEWIMAGRNVLFNKKLPYCEITENDSKQIVDKIREMKTLPLNEIGAQYYRKWLNKDNYIKKIYGYLKKTKA